MRLIDADALKKEVDNFQNCYNGWSDTYDKAFIIGAIEEQPSIEPKTKVIAQVAFDEDKLREIVHEAVERIKEEYDIVDRPQGHWIRTGRTNIYGGIEVQCSNCGDKVMVQNLEDEWFCRHCGADMREREDE